MAKFTLRNGDVIERPMMPSTIAAGFMATSIEIGVKDVTAMRRLFEANPEEFAVFLNQLEARFPENRFGWRKDTDKPIRLIPFHRDVLQHLFEDEKCEWYSSLHNIAVNLQCDHNKVRLACRALKRKGLAKQVPFHDDDGYVRGSGYGITPAGITYGEKQGWKGGDE